MYDNLRPVARLTVVEFADIFIPELMTLILCEGLASY